VRSHVRAPPWLTDRLGPGGSYAEKPWGPVPPPKLCPRITSGRHRSAAAGETSTSGDAVILDLVNGGKDRWAWLAAMGTGKERSSNSKRQGAGASGRTCGQFGSRKHIPALHRRPWRHRHGRGKLGSWDRGHDPGRKEQPAGKVSAALKKLTITFSACHPRSFGVLLLGMGLSVASPARGVGARAGRSKVSMDTGAGPSSGVWSGGRRGGGVRPRSVPVGDWRIRSREQVRVGHCNGNLRDASGTLASRQ